MGLRVAETDSGVGQHDLINDGVSPGSSLLVDHNLSAKTVAHLYTPGLEQRDGLGGALHIAGVDALGTVRAFINDDGGQAVTDTFGAYAYGIPRTRTGSDAFTFAFAGADGYQTDPNGLILLGNRVYHVYTGRFLTRDPAGAGDNDYEYCDDNPLSEIDPLGLSGDGATPIAWPGDGYGIDAQGNDLEPTDNPFVTKLIVGMGLSPAPGEDAPSASGILKLGDTLLLNGAGSHYASVSSAYIRGDVGLGRWWGRASCWWGRRRSISFQVRKKPTQEYMLLKR